MRTPRLSIVLMSLALLAPAIGEAGDLQLRIENGRVFLVARDVPARQIMAEWSRVGQTKIVNGDKVFGPPLSIELNGVPERQALETILRSATGYMAAARPAGAVGPSMYDRILIMASAGGAAPPPPPSAPRPAQPFIQPPAGPPSMMPQQGTDENEDPGNDPSNFINPNQPETFPQAQPFNPRSNPGGPFAPTPFPGPAGQQQPNNINVPALTPLPNTQPDDDDGSVGANPWGIQGGSTTPGVINPPPQGDPNQRPPN
jgi:hypothetical protein